jgi:flagellin-like protein
MLNSKGITPIISVILLLMMTVAIAGAAFFWTQRMQNQMQGGIESYQSTMLTQMSSKADIYDADYNTTTENLTIFIQNTGNTKIPIRDCCSWPRTDWILKNSNQVAICATDWAGGTAANDSADCVEGCTGGGNVDYINVGQIYKVILNLNYSLCDIGSYSGGEVFSFTIDFSGQTTTSGTFIKPS